MTQSCAAFSPAIPYLFYLGAVVWGNLGNFVHPSLPVYFGRDTKFRWSLLSGVYARRNKRSHTGKWRNRNHRANGLVLQISCGRCISCSQNTCSNDDVSTRAPCLDDCLCKTTRYYNKGSKIYHTRK